jgi:hypothetical protein
MLTLWQNSAEPEFQEITVSVPTASNPADNPQGPGTNEIQALYLVGNPTGGSYQISWGGATTPFLPDPAVAIAATPSGHAGVLNGTYRYTYTWLNLNPLGEVGETAPVPIEGVISATNQTVVLTIPPAPANTGCIGRRIYRSPAAGAKGSERLVTTIWDNSTTLYTDSLLDNLLGAPQPTSNTTGIPWNATATQLQAILQSLEPFGPGNVVVSGNGTAVSPWLVQFANMLGAQQQKLIKTGLQSYVYPITIPAGSPPTLIVTEVQKGLTPNAPAPQDGNTLLLVGTLGIPFYLTSAVAGTVQPTFTLNQIASWGQQQQQNVLSVNVVPPSLNIIRLQQARKGSNEVQQISISPDALNGSYFAVSFENETTNSIPLPPKPPTLATTGSSDNLTGNYYYVYTYLTSTGETESSAPSLVISPSAQEVTVTIANGPSVVTGKRIYRTKAGGAITGPYFLVTTVADNTTTSYTDNNTDASIATNPQPPTTNGVLQGELEALTAVGVGNVQVSGANFVATSGMAMQTTFPASPPVIPTAAITSKPGLLAVASANGGTLSTGTYYYVATSIDAQGETLPGSEVVVFVEGPTGRVTFSWSAVTGALGYRIYRGIAPSQENVLVGVTSGTTFTDYGTSPTPISYFVEFINSLGNAPQALLQGNFTGVTVLPTVTIVESQSGFPVQNEIQAVGWVQKYGISQPGNSSTYTISLPDLNVTTGPIPWSASAAGVLNALQAVLPLQHYFDITATGVKLNNAGSIVALTYTGGLALREMSLAVVNVAGMTPAPGDTLTAYNVRAAQGSPVGRNEIVVVTQNDNPSSGTFSLTGTLSTGNTISATGVAYNASAATLQAAFPAGTVNVSGNAGGPYTIEAVGEAAAQKVVWGATSSLSVGSPPSGSPPGSNGAGVDPPIVTLLPASLGGILATDTYYYKVTAVNANGETTGNEVSCAVTGPTGSVALSWNSVPTATSYSVYRGTSSGGENLKIVNVTTTSYTDYGGLHTSASPPSSNTAGLTPPTMTASLSYQYGSVIGTGTFYYKATAYTTTGETNAGSEVSVTVPSPGNYSVFITVNTVAGASGYKIYRGTSSGSENVLVANIPSSAGSGSSYGFTDSGPVNTSQSPPVSGGPGAPFIDAVVANLGSPQIGVLAPGTYYYKTTNTLSGVESGPGNEVAVTITAYGQSVQLLGNADGSTITTNFYRGTSSGGENVLIGSVTPSQADNISTPGEPADWNAYFYDYGGLHTSASPPSSNTTSIAVPTQTGPNVVSSGGALATGTYYYKVTATTSAGETTGSNEESLSITAPQVPQIIWTTDTGATGYKIYRGTSAGSENVLVATITSGTVTSFDDSGPIDTSASPPGGNTAIISAPVLVSATPATSGGVLASNTYYYEVTAYTNAGETVASNEVSATTSGSTGDVTLVWDAVTGADGYKVYRGTSSGSENNRLATVGSGVTSFVDIGNAFATFSITALITGLTPLNDTQQLAVANAGSGTFTLTLENQTTGPLAWNISAGALQTALAGLVGSGNVVVTSAVSNGLATYTISFVGQLATIGQGILSANGIGFVFPPTVNNSFLQAPIGLTPIESIGGSLPAGIYYYVVTAFGPNGETTPSNECNAQSFGPSEANRSIDLYWAAVSGATGYKVYRGIASGLENQLIGVVAVPGFLDDGTSTPQNTLQGGSTYLVNYQGTPDYITLSFGASTTPQLIYNASAGTVQSALAALSSVGTSNVTVTGSLPWSVAFSQATCTTGTLSGEVVSQGGQASGTTPNVYTVLTQNSDAGTFSLSYGRTVVLPYDATAAQVQAALAPTNVGGSVTVVGGFAGGVGSWQITITPTAQTQGFTLTGDGSDLIGISSTAPVYPQVFSLATGPNFYDAPANWSGHTLPALYLLPPTINIVAPTATNASLIAGTHGSLISGATYYYNITALNANGESEASQTAAGVPFAGAKIYFNGTPTGGAYTLSYGGLTTGSISYNANAATIQANLQSLLSIGPGGCTVIGAGTQSSPFWFELAGALAGKSPTALAVTPVGLQGATISIYNTDMRSLAVSWNYVYGATGYRVYRVMGGGTDTSAGASGPEYMVTTITNPDQTLFIDDGTYTTTAEPLPGGSFQVGTADGDNLIFTNSDVSCLYGIASDPSSGYSIHGGYRGLNYGQVASLTADSTFTGFIGLFPQNTNGYAEYRPLNLTIQGPPGGIFSISIGTGTSGGSGYISLDTGTCQIAMNIAKLAVPAATEVALSWIGNNANSEIDLAYGIVGIASLPGQTAALGTVRQGYTTNQNTDTTLYIGAGAAVSLLVLNGGEAFASSTITTIKGSAGTILQDGGGAVVITLVNCTYTSKSTGEIDSLTVSSGGVFDRSSDTRALQIGQVTLYSGASFLDPNGTVTTAGQPYIQLNTVQCGDDDVTLKLGKNLVIQSTQLG